jgi:hypothetical protein
MGWTYRAKKSKRMFKYLGRKSVGKRLLINGSVRTSEDNINEGIKKVDHWDGGSRNCHRNEHNVGLWFQCCWLLGLCYRRLSQQYVAGFSYFLRMLGPAIGYALASLCLKFYISPTLTPTIGTDDPRWLGAWWFGKFWTRLGQLEMVVRHRYGRMKLIFITVYQSR